MGAGGGLVESGAAYLSGVLAHQVAPQGYLLVLGCVGTDVLQRYWLLLFVLCLSVLSQQIVGAFIVYFDVADCHLPCELCPSLHLGIQLGYRSGNEASFLPLVPSAHGEGLARPSLSVGKDGPVVPFQAVLNNLSAHSFEHLCLGCLSLEDPVEGEELSILSIRQLVSGHLQLQGVTSVRYVGQSESMGKYC